MVKYVPTAPPGDVGAIFSSAPMYGRGTITTSDSTATPTDNLSDPGPPPANVTIEWAHDQFRQIAAALNEIDILKFKLLNSAPAKPVEGGLAFADGTNWNPGSGRGFYEYRSGAWQKL